MFDWRAVGAGLLAFPLTVVAALTEAAPWLLVAGVPTGLVTGYLSDGPLAGLLNGLLAGVGVAVLFLGGVLLVVRSADPPTYPGVGLALVAVALIAALLAVESLLAGALGGALGR